MRLHTQRGQGHIAIVEDVRSFCQVCTEFWSNSADCTAKLGVNTTEHMSEMELYIILATLENFENYKMSSSQGRSVQCSPAMIGFF